MVTEPLPSDRGQVLGHVGTGEVELCSDTKQLHLQCVGTRIWKMRFSWLCVQERGRDKDDIRSFVIAYSY